MKRNSFNHVFMYIPIGPSKKDLYKIIIGLLLIIYLIFLGMYKPKAESIESAVYYKNGNTYQLQMGNGSYADIPIKYANTAIDNAEKISFYINTDTNTNYKYMSGWIRYTMTGQSVMGKPIILFGRNDCIVNDSLTNTVNYVAFTCPNLSGKNWLDIMFQDSYMADFYISRNIGYSDIQDNNQSTLNSIGTSSQDTANNTYDIKNSSRDTANNTYDIKEGINDVNNNLNDSSIDSSSASDLTSNSAFQDSNGLDAIIKAPLNFIQSLTSSTCSAINLTIPYINADVSLPCMSTIYNKALGQQLVNLIALVINGVVLYRYCLKILQLVHNAKNPNKDELEVLDL